MGSGEQSGSGGRGNWPVKFAGAVGAGAGAALGLLVVALADLRGFWPALIAVCVGISVGVVLAQLARSLLFRQPPGNGPWT